MFRASALLGALLLSAPMWWAAIVTETATLEAAGIRFLMALPVSAVLLWLLRLATHRAPEEAADAEVGASGTGAAPNAVSPY